MRRKHPAQTSQSASRGSFEAHGKNKFGFGHVCFRFDNNQQEAIEKPIHNFISILVISLSWKKNMASRYEEIMKTKLYLPYVMGDKQTEAMRAKAKEELGETEDAKAKAIPQLRKRIEDEPDFTCPTDDAYLLQYLRPRKFDVKRAFSLLKTYYEVKRANPDLYGSFNEEATLRAMRQKSCFCLPYRDKDGCAVALFRFEKWDIDVTNAAETVIGLTIFLLVIAQEPATQICGLRLLVDVRGVNLRQIKGLIPYAYMIGRAFRNCMPIRFKGIHLYHEASVFLYLWSIMKLFMSEKIKNRIHLHGDNLKDLHKFIPKDIRKDILPAKEYGGDNPDDVAEWYNREFEKYFKTLHQLTAYGYRK